MQNNTKETIRRAQVEDQCLGETMLFHEKFDQGIPPCPCVKTNEDKIDLYAGLLDEELNELRDAMEINDEVEVLDALCDLQVVLDGAWIQSGLHVVKRDAMREVHKSNMSKLGKDDKPIYREDGKIMKGPNFFRPNLKEILNKWKEKNERT